MDGQNLEMLYTKGAWSRPPDYQSSGKYQLGAFLIFGIARTARSPYPTSTTLLKALHIFIDPFLATSKP